MKDRFKTFFVISSITISMGAISADGPVNQNFSAYCQEILGSDISIDFVPIKGGSFMMGSPDAEEGRNPDEGPQHKVEVSDFWMSTLEITWDQFELFLYRETDSQFVKENRELSLAVDGVAGATMPYVNFNKPGYPLVNVTQYAASTFCKWLSAKTGHFYRLPTEAEWEYASRTGSSKPFAFGLAEIDNYVWYSDNSEGKPQKGGKKKPNKWGLYDMHGNVAEWVLDGYNESAYSQTGRDMNPLITTEELYPRVVRGGSFNDPIKNLRSSSRQYSDKSWKKRDPQIPKSLWWLTDALHVGFRVVRPLEVPPESKWEKYWGKPIREY